MTTTWAQERAAQRREALPAMRAVCAALIAELYEDYKRHCELLAKAGPYVAQPASPHVTVSFALGYLQQASRVRGVDVPSAFQVETATHQRNMVRSAFEGLARTGAVERYTGVGRYANSEATGYAPKDDSPQVDPSRLVLGQCAECFQLNRHERSCSKNTSPCRFDVGD